MARGNYTNKAAQNVAEFTTSNPAVETENNSPAVVQATDVAESPIAKKAGRPSKGAVHKISLSIPVELLEGMELASLFFKGNKTAYINGLIRKDLEENLTRYKEFKEMLDRIR